MTTKTNETLINYGKCPVCSNPLSQTHFDTINGSCCERRLECQFCLVYEYEFDYGNAREVIAWVQWEWSTSLEYQMVDRPFTRLGISRHEQQKEFVNTFKKYFVDWNSLKSQPAIFADLLQEDMFHGETNEMLDEIRQNGFMAVNTISDQTRFHLVKGLIQSKKE